MIVKITFNVEITEKELAEALLPNGGKITDVKISDTSVPKKRTRRTKAEMEEAKKTPQ